MAFDRMINAIAAKIKAEILAEMSDEIKAEIKAELKEEIKKKLMEGLAQAPVDKPMDITYYHPDDFDALEKDPIVNIIFEDWYAQHHTEFNYKHPRHAFNSLIKYEGYIRISDGPSGKKLETSCHEWSVGPQSAQKALPTPLDIKYTSPNDFAALESNKVAYQMFEDWYEGYEQNQCAYKHIRHAFNSLIRKEKFIRIYSNGKEGEGFIETSFRRMYE